MTKNRKDRIKMSPPDLTIVDGAMALDGGSIFLKVMEHSSSNIILSLDWSIAAQQTKSARFSANGVVVPIGSEEETQWLNLIRDAEIYCNDPPSTNDEKPVSKQRLVLSKDIQDYFNAIDEGSLEALRSLANQFISVVSSEAYQNSRPLPERVCSLLDQGRKSEAIKAYREEYPGVGMEVAKAAVETIAAQAGLGAV